MNPRADLLIVDDHPVFAAGFASMVQALRPGWSVRSAATAQEALAQLAVLQPDLLVIDLVLPDMDGFALLEAVLSRGLGLDVVLISGRADGATRVRAQASGARGFIAKTAEPASIIADLERALAGQTAFAEAAAPGSAALTPRQAEILALLAEGHANKEIRYRLGIAERTVRAHLTEIFQALGANSRMQAVIRARELGLIA